MSDSEERGSAKAALKKSRGGFTLPPTLARLADPRKWSLKVRFFYTTGALLLLGCMSLIVLLVHVLGGEVERSVTEHMALARSMVGNEVKRQGDILLGQALAAAGMPAVQAALGAGDRPGLRAATLPLLAAATRAVGVSSLDLAVFPAEGPALLRSSAGAGPERPDPMAARALAAKAPAAGPALEGEVPKVKAAAPVERGDAILGVVVFSCPLASVLERLTLPPEFGLGLYAPAAAEGVRLVARSGNFQAPAAGPAAEPGPAPWREGDLFALTLPLTEGGEHGVRLLLTYNAAALQDAKWNSANLFIWVFLSGAAFLSAFLYLNVSRIERFLRRLRRILISSHSNDFAERFESDHVHCLDLLHCHNEECPVYQNPSYTCYLETGSEAISPEWRNTCVFLNKYEECGNCPVYRARAGDEISEMRNVVNTMMRLWAGFLSRVGHLLAYVLRAQEQTGRLPSLDEISARLEQMAKLTFFSRDVQGVLDKEEVYAQLGHVFTGAFDISRFVLFAVDHDAQRMVLAQDEVPSLPLCKQQVLFSSDACRACRAAEDVASFYNPVLCPHFACDHARDVRVCLPMVMSGKVGAVFSFLAPRRDWEQVRRQIPVLRKYLDEAAPVLASLSLLSLSKEQALRDPLTRCHNRRFLDEFITKYEPLTERENRKAGLLMADLDFFKQVNDEHGHEAGDAVLQQAVALMQDNIRRTDLLIRYGGEEFLALLQNVEADSAVMVAEKIRASVDQHSFTLPSGARLHKTISVGVAEFPKDALTMYKAIKFADVALYEAKRTGRNKVVRFLPEMWTEENY